MVFRLQKRKTFLQFIKFDLWLLEKIQILHKTAFQILR